jgi:S-DNA-T family DNA segregation ATPase FtsK/SpoIIIE
VNRIFTTPPGELLTATPAVNLSIINGHDIATFISAAGLKCNCINTIKAPQLVRYDIRLTNIYEYNKNKLQRIIEQFNARYNVTSIIDRSNVGDFSLLVNRTEKSPLYLKTGLYTKQYNDSNRTTITIGFNTDNCPVMIDYTTAPHILIAGTTGSGKSVLLNSLIVSLLYKQTPHNARLVMIDPKQVELSIYNKLPHLLTPVITDVKTAVNTLDSICSMMDNRYKILARKGYKQLSDRPELFPRLIVIIDELADLMLTSKKAVEQSIVRIAQLGRAAGIHLIIATQRPTTNIITGLIKANIPTKICLAVANTSDSITVLNHGGGEKLTGRGDAILKTPDTIQETRLQAYYTPTDDIKKVVEYYRKQNNIINQLITFITPG